MRRQHSPSSLSIATALAVAAALVYNSWPLGFWLNPAISNNGGLASELEAPYQPYNWLFILLDIITGLLVFAVMVILWRRERHPYGRIALVCFGLFGLLTMADALLPMSCTPSVRTCPSWTLQPVLIMHGITGVGAGAALFLSIAIIWLKQHVRRMPIQNFLMAGWLAFSVISLYFMFAPGPGYIAQEGYLALCGIWIALLPLMLVPGTAGRLISGNDSAKLKVLNKLKI